MKEETLEEMMAGDYGGLYGEVVTCDIYRLKSVKFQPDVVFDIGANIGIFTRYARTLFPKAFIVAVEPDPDNRDCFTRFTQDPNSANSVLLPFAIGWGKIYHGTTARNGSGATYLSAGLGYSKEALENAIRAGKDMVETSVSAMTLSGVVRPYLESGMKSLMKIDIEGAENSIWRHKPSMEVLRQMDYISIELHDFALTAEERPSVIKETEEALKWLEHTHRCERDKVNFWATKK